MFVAEDDELSQMRARWCRMALEEVAGGRSIRLRHEGGITIWARRTKSNNILCMYVKPTQSQLLLGDCHLDVRWFSRPRDLVMDAVSKVFTASARRTTN